MLTKSQVLDAIKKSLVLYKTNILDNEYSTKKYVDDAIANASGGSGGTSGNCNLTDTLKAQYDAAYTHSQAAHAPSNAQKNSDITKSEIEAKLTGDITTHTHSQYLTSIPSEYITEQELTSKGYATATTHEEVKTTVNQILGGAYIE